MEPPEISQVRALVRATLGGPLVGRQGPCLTEGGSVICPGSQRACGADLQWHEQQRERQRERQP